MRELSKDFPIPTDHSEPSVAGEGSAFPGSPLHGRFYPDGTAGPLAVEDHLRPCSPGLQLLSQSRPGFPGTVAPMIPSCPAIFPRLRCARPWGACPGGTRFLSTTPQNRVSKFEIASSLALLAMTPGHFLCHCERSEAISPQWALNSVEWYLVIG